MFPMNRLVASILCFWVVALTLSFLAQKALNADTFLQMFAAVAFHAVCAAAVCFIIIRTQWTNDR